MARGRKYVDTSIYRDGDSSVWSYRRPLLLSAFRLAPNAFAGVVSERYLAANDHMRHVVRWAGGVVEGNYAFTRLGACPLREVRMRPRVCLWDRGLSVLLQ